METLFGWFFNLFGCYENTPDKPRSWTRAMATVFGFFAMAYFWFSDKPSEIVVYALMTVILAPYGINKAAKILEMLLKLVAILKGVPVEKVAQ